MEDLTEAEREVIDLLRNAGPSTQIMIIVTPEGMTIGGQFPAFAELAKMPSDTEFMGCGDDFDAAWMDIVPLALRSTDAKGMELARDADTQAALDAWRRQHGRPSRPVLRLVRRGEG